ncbi:GNAT family N-acetyltransferase [Lysobacter solisilvae (ex Woo and Kim 2020)]|uniref:GNAT family N-acetyltransferase n=1 Tax=Agrilutibacter terrestris TaxID=2865112 RepID=A0A7H0FZ31_9GAMM|nr:GNAT family N-acetyltransferase [Lysobacter terrestris]QNP41297.1 GNAT family N-acetyltransferase [Lysobacter terrestris]
MSTHVRRAVPTDAAVLAALGAATFTEAFGHLYSAQDLQAFIDESHAVSAYETLLQSPLYALWLAEADGEAIGYALAGPCGLPHEDARREHGELKRLYVSGRVQGGGVGAKLFDQALAWLERDGPRPLWISVWSENYGAQRFYARYGFEKAGEYEFIVGQQRDREFMYRRVPRG